MRNSDRNGNPWPEPLGLRSATDSPPTMSIEIVPSSIRSWVEDISKRMNCPIEMAAVTAIAAYAGFIGRRCGVKPKENDSWIEIPNLWGALIAPPSRLKSSILKAVYQPIFDLEDEAHKEFQPKREEHHRNIEKLRFELNLLKKTNDCAMASEIADKTIQIERLNRERPEAPRFVVNDATVEKLGELLANNPAGLTMLRDELSGFLFGLQKSGHESDRAFYLEAWTGSGRNMTDRIGRGTIRSIQNCVSVFGTIQPDMLNQFFHSSITKQNSGDGMFQRFQLMVYPDLGTEYTYVDQAPDHQAAKTAERIFRKIQNLNYEKICDDPSSKTPYLKFSPEAQRLFSAWLTDLEFRLRSGKIESPAYEAHLGKFRGLLPSLALIFHLIQFDSKNPLGHLIGIDETKAALAWCELLEAHALKIYSMFNAPARTASLRLAQRILDGDISDNMTVRSVYRKQWSGLKNSKTVVAGLDELETLNWVRIEKAQHSQSDLIRLNPLFTASPMPTLGADGSIIRAKRNESLRNGEAQ